MQEASRYWSEKLTNVAQVGGIETAVLDNGAGRGVRVAWFNTGAGLRFKVVLDRAMDIADAFFNQHGLAWLSHLGPTYPQPFSDKGADWLRTFGGGLLTTCGLTHVGGPEADEFGERGVHGWISNIPAEIESVIQPDPSRGKYEMSITGVMRETKIFGPSLELRRTLTATLGKSSIRIKDEVINRGNTAAPHMLLYHCNVGWPLADEGSLLLWKGKTHKKNEKGELVEFTPEPQFKQCPALQDAHLGNGEEIAVVDVEADTDGKATCGIFNPGLGLSVVLRFSKKQLPWMTNWRHWAKGEYVTGLEPGTHPPIGQSKARADHTLIFIQPGESKEYEVEIEVIHDENTNASILKSMS
jgi:hypothetical protein